MEELILVATLGLLVAVALILKSQHESLRSLDQKLENLTLLLKSSLQRPGSEPGRTSREESAPQYGGTRPNLSETGHSGSAAAPLNSPVTSLAVNMEREDSSAVADREQDGFSALGTSSALHNAEESGFKAEQPEAPATEPARDAPEPAQPLLPGLDRDAIPPVDEAAKAAAAQTADATDEDLVPWPADAETIERWINGGKTAAPQEQVACHTQESVLEADHADKKEAAQESEPVRDENQLSEPGSASEAVLSGTGADAATAGQAPARVDGIVRTVFNFIRGGNIWVAGGVLLLLAGFSFLISFMAERGMLSVEMSIALAALGGIAMVVFGLYLRQKKRIYAMVMQGGGIGVLYLAAFAAAKLTTVLSPAAALLLMTLLIIPAVILAMKQQAEVLAIFGFLGGYAAPVLLSTGSGDYVLLFSYYMLLNITLLGICRFRLWRWLNLLGATCSFGIMGAWGFLSYEPAMFTRVEPFLLGFMVIFLLITMISVHKREFSLANPPDISLALGVPLAAVAFQWKAAAGLEHGLSLSALAFGAFFILLAALLHKIWGAKTRRLMEIYAASGALLVNLSVPLEFSGVITSGIWAAEGALTFFFGCRFGSGKVRTAGLGLQAAAMVSYSFGLTSPDNQGRVLLETALLALSALSSAYFQMKLKERENTGADDGDTGFTTRMISIMEETILLERLLTYIGLFWWFTGLGIECWRFAGEPGSLFFLLASASSALFFLTGRWLRLPYVFASLWVLVAISLFLLLVPIVPTMADAAQVFYLKTFDDYPFLPGVLMFSHSFLSGLEGLSWLAYAIALAVFFLTASSAVSDKLKGHLATLCTLEAVLVLTCSCRAFALPLQFSPAWADLAGIVPSLGYIFAIVTAIRLAFIPPLYIRPLFVTTPLILFATLAVWVVCGFTDPGNPGPQLRYIPLLNPLELQQALCFGMFLLWGMQLHSMARKLPHAATRRVIRFTALLGFAWLHSIIIRATHYYTDAPFGFGVWHENLFQVLLTALWGLSGMAAIALGHAKKMRLLWIAGALLIALDTAKLFFKDLADKDTLYHIVSLFVVGGIFLLVGLMAPLPPAARDEQDAAAETSGNGEQTQEKN